MLDTLIRLLAAVGPEAIWIIIFFAAMVAVFVIYISIEMRAAMRAANAEQQQLCYRMFRDLLELFRKRRQQ